MKRIAQRVTLVAAASLCGLLLAEIALRIVAIGFPLAAEPDAQAGWKLQPGFSQWFSREGGALVQVNRHGFRDVEHTPAKPAGTFRVAVLGDSYAEAVQVPREQTFWSLLATRLQDCADWGGQRVEVLNFGVSGYGTAQELIVLRNDVWQFQPDLVLLAFFSGTRTEKCTGSSARKGAPA